MNFAPYQDAPPERERALSPPISPRVSLDNHNQRPRPHPSRVASPAIGTNALGGRGGASRQGSYFGQQQNGGQGWGQGRTGDRIRDVEAGVRSPGWASAAAAANNSNSNSNGSGLSGTALGGSGSGTGFGGAREDVDLFETRLGLRMDYEACLAYLGVPPVAGVLLLVLEQRSDYVRFHAWQSSLLFSFLFIIHVIFSWSSVISWMLFACDLALIGWLTFRAYQDAGTLDRCEVPFFGPLASSILDDE